MLTKEANCSNVHMTPHTDLIQLESISENEVLHKHIEESDHRHRTSEEDKKGRVLTSNQFF